MITYLDLQRPLDDNVKLLTIVGVKLDGGVLFLSKEGEFNEKGLSQLVLELGRKVVIYNTLFLDYFKTLALSGDSERGKGGTCTFKYINYFNSAGFGTLINKSKAEICLSRLKNNIVLKRNTGELCKLLL